jgi:hypothetical protein
MCGRIIQSSGLHRGVAAEFHHHIIDANELVADIHHRMPVILAAGRSRALARGRRYLIRAI